MGALFNRTKTVDFKDFMSGGVTAPKANKNVNSRVKKAAKLGVLTPVALALPSRSFAEVSGSPDVIQANAVGDAIRTQITNAFDPIIDVMIALSLPIAGVMVTGGALLVMIGLNDKGYGLLMKAGIGYVLVQMSPLFIDLLAGVGQAI
ncbi:hypothetical protein [Thalassobacillus sp. CUG 92003]|uniref:hypothetical protein n=1 Tax=Thalassobacillus sp. CUG 92003 TaxID=2736641 RepID=UPI0015E7A2D6|nr:hypothetical protein [Thalassobacillus sp. CUG 92003]